MLQGSHVRELQAKADTLQRITRQVQDANPSAGGSRLKELIRAEVAKRGENYLVLTQAAKNLAMVEAEAEQFEALLRSQNGLALELRWFQELVGALAGATVQGPGTALVQFADLGQAFAKTGLGGVSASIMRRSLQSFAAESFGTLAQAFHLRLKFNAERNARRTRNGIIDPDARRRFGDVMTAALMDPSGDTQNAATRNITRGARLLRALTTSGFGQAEGETAYVTLKPHAVFSQIALQQQMALIDGWVGAFEDLAQRAVDYFQNPANAADLINPEFRFDRQHLGYAKSLFGFGIISDERAFDYLYDALGRYGMSLEQVARDVLSRRRTDPAATLFTDQQFRALASLVQNEVTLDSSPATRPSRFFTNPVLHLANPLLGWSLSKSQDTWKAYRNPNMTQTSENALAAFLIGLKPYLALVPIALAIAWLRDEYDEELLRKKANRASPDSLEGMVDSLARVGTFGAFGDVTNAMANRDTERPFSVDNRVFALSMIFNAARTLSAWHHQGSADYPTVYRPLIQSLGGSGYLQYAQLLNTLTSQFGDGEPLFQAEARVTARINSLNHLRVVGRQLAMDVRVNMGGETLSNPIKPLIGQMVLASYANDPMAFRIADPSLKVPAHPFHVPAIGALVNQQISHLVHFEPAEGLVLQPLTRPRLRHAGILQQPWRGWEAKSQALVDVRLRRVKRIEELLEGGQGLTHEIRLAFPGKAAAALFQRIQRFCKPQGIPLCSFESLADVFSQRHRGEPISSLQTVKGGPALAPGQWLHEKGPHLAGEPLLQLCLKSRPVGQV